MTTYQKVFLAYVKALKKRNEALTEGDWAIANDLCLLFKKWLTANAKQ